jgi:4,5-dihydroxyphthalate decarboxylase
MKTAIGTYGHTKALKDGTVRPKRVELAFEEVSPIIAAFRRMVRGLEFDVSEMAISTYLCARAFNKPFTAIPIFPVRAFHHGAIVYNTRSGIKGPGDLAGRKVGVNRGYTVTTGLWARGILQSQYGVDLNKVTWVLSGDEHVQEWKAPSNVVTATKGKDDLAQLLLAGEIDAAIGVGTVDSPDVMPLIPDARNAGYQWFNQTGIYPINHTVVVKDALLAANPWIAEELFIAFKGAKQAYLDRLAAGKDLAPEDQSVVQLKSVVGPDPFPYGIEANRKALEAALQFNFDQKIIPRRVSVEEVFAKNTLSLK